MNTKPARAAILVLAGLALLLTSLSVIRDGAGRLSADFPSVKQTALVAFDQSINKLEFAPRLVNGAWPLGIEAKAFAVALLRPSGELDILLEKNGRERLPIASVAKLLTAMVAADELEPLTEVVLRPEHFLDRADLAGLQPGEHFLVRDLLYPLLISSSNAAAVALADQLGEKQFVAQMNETALREGLGESYFYNPTGLDPLAGDDSSSVNYSTAYDLVKIARLLILQYQPLLALTRLPEYDLYSRDRALEHHLLNTNKLVDVVGLPARLLGGKTGQTDLALKNILLIFETAPPAYLVVAVLGAADHLQAAEQLLNWVYQAYDFS